MCMYILCSHNIVLENLMVGTSVLKSHCDKCCLYKVKTWNGTCPQELPVVYNFCCRQTLASDICHRWPAGTYIAKVASPEELLLIDLPISIPVSLINHLLQLLVCSEAGVRKSLQGMIRCKTGKPIISTKEDKLPSRANTTRKEAGKTDKC